MSNAKDQSQLLRLQTNQLAVQNATKRLTFPSQINYTNYICSVGTTSVKPTSSLSEPEAETAMGVLGTTVWTKVFTENVHSS